MPVKAKPTDVPEEPLRRALAELLKADLAYIQSYDAWLFAPEDPERDRGAEVAQAQQRVDLAWQEALKWESRAHATQSSLEPRGPD